MIVAVILVFLLILPTPSLSLPDNYKASIRQNMSLIKQKSTLYVWGAAGSEKDGVLQVDCSGLLHYIYKKSGVGGVKRSTAFRMRHGLEGWTGVDVPINNCDDLDIPFWSWKAQPNRPFGHVGIITIGGKSRLMEVMHASSSKKGVVVNPMAGVFMRDLSAIRRITIGDKK